MAFIAQRKPRQLGLYADPQRQHLTGRPHFSGQQQLFGLRGEFDGRGGVAGHGLSE